MNVLISSMASPSDFTPAHHSVRVKCGDSIVATNASPGSIVSEALLAMDIASFSYLFARTRTSWECTKVRVYCRVQRLASMPEVVERSLERRRRKASLRLEESIRRVWRRLRDGEDMSGGCVEWRGRSVVLEK